MKIIDIHTHCNCGSKYDVPETDLHKRNFPFLMEEYKNGLVEFKNVYKVFDQKEILHDISFKINKGKIIGLLGKNGMGKSTIIKLLNGLLTPTSGEVLINNNNNGVDYAPF